MSHPTDPRETVAVPDWRRELGSTPAPRPTLALLVGALCAAAFLAYQGWLLAVLVDWRGSITGEGLIGAAAARIREGRLPYRDFFLPGAPGAPFLHAGLHLGREGGRAAALFVSFLSGALALRFARAWEMPRTERWLLVALLAAWSFSLWNMASGAWYATFFTLLALSALPRSVILAGALFALAFWFLPAIGGGGALGSLAWLLSRRDRGSAARLLCTFALFTVIPAAGAGPQLFLPAGFAGDPIPPEMFAAPLTTLGLWMLSLFFLRSDSQSRSARFVQLGVLAYGGIYAARAPEQFTHAGFMLLSLAAWPFSLAIALIEKAGRARFLALWLPGFLALLFLGRSAEFPRFLFFFPFSALLLTYSLARMHARYRWLPPFWARLPALALLAGGLWLQAGMAGMRWNGVRDSLGFVSEGQAQRLDEEVTAVWRALHERGLKPGDPLLVVPDAPGMYEWTGFRNPTFFLAIPPGAGPELVLPAYRQAGGRFVVVEERSGLDGTWFSRQIQLEYQEVKSFPEHFTIYEPRQSQAPANSGTR